MNATHFHLLANHVVILGVVLGIPLLLVGMARRSQDLKRAAMLFFLLAAVLVVPVFQSGESSEDVAEKLPAVTESIIEEHEEAAEFARLLTILLGFGSLTALVMSRSPQGGAGWRGWVPTALLVLAVIDAAALARTGNLGGLIRHSEIRADAGQQAPAAHDD